MSWTEITKKFTASEMAMMAWASQEQMLSLERDSPKERMNKIQESQDFLQTGIGNPNYMKDQYNDFSAKRDAVSDEGDVDLRQFKGIDIWNYMRSQGIIFPIVARSKKPPTKE